MCDTIKKIIFCIFLLGLVNCVDFLGLDTASSSPTRKVEGTPTEASKEIYATADWNKLCIDASICLPDYDSLPETFSDLSASASSAFGDCPYDLDPSSSSLMEVRNQVFAVNGIKLLFSKQDLFFLAWVSVRLHINPHFLIGVMLQESAGDCAAVSYAGAEGCFQITNSFGKAQLTESYPDRIASWAWADRSSDYYPDSFFVDPLTYFGETPTTNQFRLTLDPSASTINSEAVSSIVNFPFGVIASGLYMNWQHYFLFYNESDAVDSATKLFAELGGKAAWQAAAYNGGITRASNALVSNGNDFLLEMLSQTQDYVPRVVDYCSQFENGDDFFDAEYSKSDLDEIVDLLAVTYANQVGKNPTTSESNTNDTVNWSEVKDELHQIFFADPNQKLHFVSDIKAVIYVISTHTPLLAPEWPVL